MSQKHLLPLSNHDPPLIGKSGAEDILPHSTPVTHMDSSSLIGAFGRDQSLVK
jgi:hypothetical protein